jgi:hypothetical protein
MKEAGCVGGTKRQRHSRMELQTGLVDFDWIMGRAPLSNLTLRSTEIDVIHHQLRSTRYLTHRPLPSTKYNKYLIHKGSNKHLQVLTPIFFKLITEY